MGGLRTLETILFDRTGKREMNSSLQEECLLWGNRVVIPRAGRTIWCRAKVINYSMRRKHWMVRVEVTELMTWASIHFE